MEEFKASSKMKDLNITFGQKALIKGFKLYEGRVARKFSVLDLSFLKEEPNKEAGSSDAVVNPSLIKVVFESFELAIEVPEPMQEPNIVSKSSIEPIPEPMATPGVSNSSTASSSKIGGL
ncbi:hypothetical protein COCNU_scaffold002266G000010 [Cocos nucifera]|nr:hypothetical protein [Cocos nucifera]